MATICGTKTENREDGCKYADDLLGEESFCAACPFTDCVKGEIDKYYRNVRNPQIVKLIKSGMTQVFVANMFDLTTRRIRQILRESDEGR